MLAFLCMSVFHLASDTIEKLVFVCLSVCVFVRICVSTCLYHTSLTVGRLLSTYSGNRSKVMTCFSRSFDVMVILLYHDVL